jgi:ribonucleoside-diphosphate reductase beta chain
VPRSQSAPLAVTISKEFSTRRELGRAAGAGDRAVRWGLRYCVAGAGDGAVRWGLFGRLAAMADTAARRTDRADFRATSDPGLAEAGSHGQPELLTYRQLYALWERQHWAVGDLDFSRDRVDWHERIDAEERYARMYGLSSFFVGEQRVAAELGPIMRACPQEDMRMFLCTQIADEARHVAFFDRFYSEVGVLRADDLAARLRETSEHLNDNFGILFDQMLHDRVDRLAAEPGDLEALVEAITLYHMVIEGMLALTGQHFIIDYNERMGTLPAFVEGFTNVARDEHRHVAFGARFLRDMARSDQRYARAIQRTLTEVVPVADGVLRPPWAPADEHVELFGSSVAETRAFALTALQRRMKAIGLPA